jgi:hypothetical protein
VRLGAALDGGPLLVQPPLDPQLLAGAVRLEACQPDAEQERVVASVVVVRQRRAVVAAMLNRHRRRGWIKRGRRVGDARRNHGEQSNNKKKKKRNAVLVVVAMVDCDGARTGPGVTDLKTRARPARFGSCQHIFRFEV